MKIEHALTKLFSLHQFGIKLGLDSITNLLNFIGNPQRKLKCYHIAGSNGKGSTSSFIASILMEAGMKTGLYTSPHLIKFNERIRINGKEVEDDFILYFMNLVNDYMKENPVTFFELTTAMAFLYFAQNNVDYAVIETGLGGRLDATNIINPVASIITTISLEHTNILGNSLISIAKEKCEIIKSNSKAFIGLVAEEVKPIFKEKSIQSNSEFFFISDFIKRSTHSVDLQTGNVFFRIYETPLRGEHQLINAALAILAVCRTQNDISGLIFSRGIKHVLLNSKIQCRYEIYNDCPKVIFDSAHNFEGVQSFVTEFKKESGKYEKKILLYGSMKDKDYEKSIQELANQFDHIYTISIDYERCADKNELSEIANLSGVKSEPLDNPENFIRNFILNKNSRECLVALGSIYILGQVKSKLLSNSINQSNI